VHRHGARTKDSGFEIEYKRVNVSGRKAVDKFHRNEKSNKSAKLLVWRKKNTTLVKRQLLFWKGKNGSRAFSA